MNKKLLFSLLFMAVVSTFISTQSVYAKEDNPPRPSGPLAPDSVFIGPGGWEWVIVGNVFYPLSGGKVKTDGWSEANFEQPLLWTHSCRAKVWNDQGQSKETSKVGGDDWGCQTPLATINSAKHPATYTSRTQAWWHWPDLSDEYAQVVQTNYQP